MKKATLYAVFCTFFGFVYTAAAVQLSLIAPQTESCKTLKVANLASPQQVSENSQVAIAATANTGWAFAGWYASYDNDSGTFSNAVALVNEADWRTASAKYQVGAEDVTLYARFVTPDMDSLSFNFAEPFGDAEENEIALGDEFDALLPLESLSFPTITVNGLPTGLTFNKSTMRLSGSATVPGRYTVKISASNVSKYSYSQVFYVNVASASTDFIDVSDCEDELYVGEAIDSDWPLDLDYYFSISETNAAGKAVKTVSVTGLPTGLIYKSYVEDDYVYREISGTPTAAGVFAVKCEVTYADGYKETAYSRFTVNDLDPVEYNVDFSGLSGFSVGDSVDSESDWIYLGVYDYYSEDRYGEGVTSVTGLPTGLSVKKVRVSQDGGDYTDEYYAYGTFTAAGEFKVSVNVSYYDWETEKAASAKVSGAIVVGAVQDKYVSVSLLDPDYAVGCKVTGGGVVKVGKTVTLSATAARDYSFAGWCDYAEQPAPFGDLDYRTARLTFTVAGDTEVELYADFVKKTEDTVEFSELDGAEFELDPQGEEAFLESFSVDSASLPTLTFKNLPTGVVCNHSSEFSDGFELYFDPATATAAKTPKPGRYVVTATAKNVSGNTATATFTIKVANLTSEFINVKDDYGVLAPNVEMEPIYFTNAVDFAAGWTLAVSGLPTGLKYDTTAKKLYGKPTKPGEYVLNFNAKFGTKTNETATSYIKVKDFPTVAVVVEEEASAAGNKVTGAGSYSTAKANLKATAAKGWVFAGWQTESGESYSGDMMTDLNPSLAYTMTMDDLVTLKASFVELRDDALAIADTETATVVFVKNEQVSTNLMADLIETVSLPTVSVTGLPSGLKFDTKTLVISGKPTKTGVSYATFTAKNAGGYTFVKVFRFAVVETAESEIPEDVEKNDANIDFDELDGLTTGEYYPEADVTSIGFAVPTNAVTGALVTKVALTGLPTGLSSSVEIVDGEALVTVYGTPTKPGRFTLKVTATYADRKTAVSEHGLTVQDGGSGWLDVYSFDETLGTVTGSGVYASGAKVTLKATAKTGDVFAGWYEDEDEDHVAYFENLEVMDGVDYRTANASFLFRKGMFTMESPALYAYFVTKDEDVAPEIEFEPEELWEVDPSEDSTVSFYVESWSLPKLTVSGLPKGVVCDTARGTIVYDSTKSAQIVPGYYTITVKAVNQSNKQTTAALKVFVANKTSEVINGLESASDAYVSYAGVNLEEIIPEVDLDDGWTLSVSGLPAGLKFVTDKEGKTVTGYHIDGVATKAATNTVTFTATRTVDRVKETAVATITLSIAALPAWAQGNFNGIVYDVDTNAIGSVSMDVTAAGKVSGKLLTGGKSYSFSASAFETFDDGMTNFLVTAGGYEIAVWPDANGNGCAEISDEPVADVQVVCELAQNLWKRKLPGLADFKAGTKATFNDLTCTFAAGGGVTFAGKVDGVSVTGGKSQVLIAEDESAYMVLYVANAKLSDGVYCEECRLEFTIDKTTGKITGVKITSAEE